MAVIENSGALPRAGQSAPLQRRSILATAVAAALALAVAYAYQAALRAPQTGAASATHHSSAIAGAEMNAMHMPGMQMSEVTDPVAGRPQSVLTPVSCQKLPDIPGKTMTTMLVDYPPNGFTPRHRHPGNVTAIVLKGMIRSQLLGGPAVDYKKGQSWFEPPGAIHLFAENPSKTESAQMLAIFVADSDCGALVIPDTGK
jgi:quercetin dioxygenase-like cupin family protein